MNTGKTPDFDTMTEAQFANYLAKQPAIVRWLHHLDTLHDQATEWQTLAERSGRVATSMYASRIAQACSDAIYQTNAPNITLGTVGEFSITPAQERFLASVESALKDIERTVMVLPAIREVEDEEEDEEEEDDEDDD